MKAGTRLKSIADDTEVMVIRAGAGTISCGGWAMTESKSSDSEAVKPEFSSGTLMGKRYVDTDGAYELLCVKPGKGSLAVDGAALAPKDAKPLPASD